MVLVDSCFFNDIDEILGAKPTMSCSHTIDTSSSENSLLISDSNIENSDNIKIKKNSKRTREEEKNYFRRKRLELEERRVVALEKIAAALTSKVILNKKTNNLTFPFTKSDLFYLFVVVSFTYLLFLFFTYFLFCFFCDNKI